MLRLFDNNAKITSIVVLCVVSAVVLIPSMTEVTKIFHSFIVNDFSDTESPRLKTEEVNTFALDIYTPPDYGAPDSQHGSGTR
ncbi:hypothetical protein [Anabaena cylindrica]|uniref:hypothetical protein n=1 Tax=Anabaena cylindrica TaxID=1165 RepID=UPI002B200CE0|nr:hypothetical protein [Anabaena cylindrica]